MTFRFVCALIAGSLAAGCLLAGPLAAAEAKDPLAPGARSGPFVVSTRTLSDLTKDGYEIRGNLGTALVLQKAASIFTCSIPPDPEHLSYRSYFVCSELKEERPAASALPPQEPRLKLDMPRR